MRKFIKPADFIVVAVLLVISALLLCFFSFDNAKYIVIYSDGEEYGRYSVADSEKQIVEISTEYGRNVVVIADGKAWVTETSCKDKTEVKAGVISKPGQSLVCLPNRLVITVEGRITTDATAF